MNGVVLTILGVIAGVPALLGGAYGARQVYRGAAAQAQPLNLSAISQSYTDAQKITEGIVQLMQEQIADLRSDLESFRTKLATAEQRIVDLTRDLENERSDRNRVERELAAAKAEVADLVARLHQAGVPTTPTS